MLIRPVHRAPTLIDILPKLNNAKYLSFTDACSVYHNLKLDKRSFYLMMFACQLGRYRYKRLLFGAAPAGDMFQRKIDEIFKELSNVFSIADDILVAGYEADGKDHDKCKGAIGCFVVIVIITSSKGIVVWLCYYWLLIL